MNFLIFSGGTMHSGTAVLTAISQFDKVIAADSGAQLSLLLNIFPDYVIGDFDSIDKKTLSVIKKRNIPLLQYPSEKDKTDTQLAVEFAIKKGASKINILGAVTGDRIDHIIASILLSTNYKIPISLIDANSTIISAKGPFEINLMGNTNDILTLIPISTNVSGIKTEGLKYPLKDESLSLGETRGVSNVFTLKKIKINIKSGQLLIIHKGL